MTIAETAKWLSENDKYLIITHRKPDGDTLCSAAALAAGLRKYGKTAYLAPNPEMTERFVPYMGGYFAPEGYEQHKIIAVDTAGESLFPDSCNEYKGKVDLCIDHHTSNSRYAVRTCLYPSSAACGEIVCKIIMELCGELDAEIAKQVYIAITTDTGCFVYSNTNAETFRVAALCVESGAPNREINKKFFRTKTKSRIALEGFLMSGLEFYRDGTVAISSITLDIIKKCGVTEDDMEDIASIPGVVEGVDVGITIRERPGGHCKVSVRTTPAVNANDICSRLGGGGHPGAAGCVIEAGLKESKKRLLKVIDEVWH